MPQPRRGVPEVVPALGPQHLDLDQELRLFGIEAVPTFLQTAAWDTVQDYYAAK